MKNKIIAAIVIIALAVGGFFAFKMLSPKTVQGAKEISYKIVDQSTTEEKVLFEGKIRTDAETLAQAMIEAEELQLEYESSEFGMYITSLMGVSQTQDTGPWWIYSSENNETCLANAFCPAIDATPIKDQDSFTFTLTSTFE